MGHKREPDEQLGLFDATDEMSGAEPIKVPRDESGRGGEGIDRSIDKSRTSAPLGYEREEDALDQYLDVWRELGWLRPLDVHFARFLHPDDDAVRLAAALVSHQLGQGHICLDLERTLNDPSGVLSLPPQDGRAEQKAPEPRELLSLLGITHCDEWRRRLLASSQVCGCNDLGEFTPAPLVLDGTRLYLYRLWNAEGRVARSLSQGLDILEDVDSAVAEHLDELFPRNPRLAADEPDWQKVACALAASKRLAIISGGPGTGKTTTVVKLLAVLQRQALQCKGRALNIRLSAPTGKAAARLAESIGGAMDSAIADPELRAQITREATTLHRLLGTRPDSRHFRHNAASPLPLDVLVIDEASMIDLELMGAVLDALPVDARLILLGDRDQLASVEAGAVMGELCAGSEGFSPVMNERLIALTREPLKPHQPQSPLADHVVTLERSYRFDSASGIGALARAVNNGDTTAVRACWMHGYRDIQWLSLKGDNDSNLIAHAVDGYRSYLQDIKDISPDEALSRLGNFQLLCALRRGPWGVAGLNANIQTALVKRGLITANAEWYVGRPVMVTRNDNQLGLYNGDIGLTLSDPEDPGRLKVFFAQQDGVRAVSPGRLNDVETAFAMTVHKSQGSEFKRVLLVLPDRPNPILTREFIYTGITRAREYCTIASVSPELIELAAQRRIWRDANLRARIEY